MEGHGAVNKPVPSLSPTRCRHSPGADELCTRVNAILHLGAATDWLAPYAALKPVNVVGTQETGTRRREWRFYNEELWCCVVCLWVKFMNYFHIPETLLLNKGVI